jgi:hypothetical protein
MAVAEIYVRDPEGKIHHVSKEISEIYRQRGWRVLNSRPPLNDIAAHNNEINKKIMEEREELNED